MNRRDVLLAAAAGAVAPFVATAADGARNDVRDASFDRPDRNLRALLKMLGSTDPRDVAVSFGTGRVYACIAERAPIPLFGTHSVSVTRSRLRPDGSFVLRQRIVGFRTEFDGEQPIDRMTNPVTGGPIDLPATDYGLSDVEYRLDGTYALRAGQPPAKLDRPTPRPWRLDAGTLAIHDDALLSGAGPGQPKVDVVTRFARLDEIVDDAVRSARSWFSFSAVDPFRPWLKMDRAGFQLWHVHGRAISAAEPMPAFIDRYVRERFPTLTEFAPP